MAGFNLPPGCTTRMIDQAFGQEGPCAVCAKPVDICICPECPVCESQGDPKCYGAIPQFQCIEVKPEELTRHGLKLSRDQVISRSEARIVKLQEMITDEGQYIEYLKQGGEFDDELANSPDPWG